MRHALILLATLCAAAVAAEPADLALGTDGRLHLAVDGTAVCTFAPFTADPQWKFGAPVAGPAPAADAPRCRGASPPPPPPHSTAWR
ncbi:MAG: hypothetical protein L6R48_02010 [Planctomycetes bacterium]|nr:hypothetical protein [Planctomycetota bacterium]